MRSHQVLKQQTKNKKAKGIAMCSWCRIRPRTCSAFLFCLARLPSLSLPLSFSTSSSHLATLHTYEGFHAHALESAQPKARHGASPGSFLPAVLAYLYCFAFEQPRPLRCLCPPSPPSTNATPGRTPIRDLVLLLAAPPHPRQSPVIHQHCALSRRLHSAVTRAPLSSIGHTKWQQTAIP